MSGRRRLTRTARAGQAKSELERHFKNRLFCFSRKAEVLVGLARPGPSGSLTSLTGVMQVLLERRRIGSTRTLWVILCSLLVALVGCGGSSKTGTVSGTVTFGGVPASQSGASEAMLPGRVVLLDSGGQTVATQEVKSGQQYRFEVSPGSYQLVVVLPGGHNLCGSPVRVAEGQTADRTRSCGIP
jgi:hypothetical protein